MSTATIIVNFMVCYTLSWHMWKCLVSELAKALKFCPYIIHLFFPTELNGFRSLLKKVERSCFSILWHFLLVFISLFRHNTCRNLTGWGANVLLVNIVPKHGNAYLKYENLKPINLLIFFFLPWCYIFSVGSAVKCYTVIWIELFKDKNLFKS